MNFAELEQRGLELTEKQVGDGLRILSTDPNFVALVEWLRRNESAWAGAVADQSLAEHHGKLSHAAGSLYALQLLRSQLKKAVVKGGSKPATTLEPSE